MVSLKDFPNSRREFVATCRHCGRLLVKGEAMRVQMDNRKRMVCRDTAACAAWMVFNRRPLVQHWIQQWEEGVREAEDDIAKNGLPF